MKKDFSRVALNRSIVSRITLGCLLMAPSLPTLAGESEELATLLNDVKAACAG